MKPEFEYLCNPGVPCSSRRHGGHVCDGCGALCTWRIYSTRRVYLCDNCREEVRAARKAWAQRLEEAARAAIASQTPVGMSVGRALRNSNVQVLFASGGRAIVRRRR